MFEIYTRAKISDSLYAITERHSDGGMTVMMYLVIGSERAALIDSGFGLTDTLKNMIEEITPLPIICLVAHGHPDHVGAAALFDKVYMNRRDDSLLPISLSAERRLGDAEHGGADAELIAHMQEHMVMPEKLGYEDIDGGAVIDLGGKQLEVFAIPGHTAGSLAFYDREGNYALTSDCFSTRTALVMLPPEKRVGIAAYRDGIDRFLSAINDDTVLYWGHSAVPLSQQVPKDMLKACGEVLDGLTDQDNPSINRFTQRSSAAGKRMMEHNCGCVTLVYDANTL